ncbi:ankyrin repeat-containing domain protein [Trichoderma chlorosporum]
MRRRISRFTERLKKRKLAPSDGTSPSPAPTSNDDLLRSTPPPSALPSVQSGAVTIVASIRPNDDTWALAFEMAQEREGKLMLAYEEYLSTLQDDNAAGGGLSIPEFITSIVKRALEEREKKKWCVSLLGTDIEVRAQAERLAKFLLWSDSIVKAAVSSQPYAALAWSGVSLLLPLVTSSITQNEAMLKGFNSISDVQMYWRICEESHLPSLNKLSYQQPLAKLYSFIIEYQARVICHLSKGQLSRAWNDTISPEEWDKGIQQIDQLDQGCRDILSLAIAHQIERHWKEQLNEMQESRVFLDKIYNTLLESGMDAQKSYEDKNERELLQLLASDYQGYKDFNPKRVEGTCEWFFTDERFRNWRDSNASSLLWVSAGPGCGKSVLSRALIDERRLSTNVTTSTVCYFFFKDGDESRMYAHNALCAILHQLFTHDLTGSLIAQAQSSQKNFGETLTRNFSELWGILVRCANSSSLGEIVCAIDGLDECHADTRTGFIRKLQEYYGHPSERSSKLKFFITSRPYDTIEAPFKKLSGATTYLRFDGDEKSADISREINLVIDVAVTDITQEFKDKDRLRIIDRLKSMEHRTYLWLHLTLDIIKKSPSEYGRRIDVETLLSGLPSEVSEAYEKMLNGSKRHAYTEALLQILLAATRPLTLEEVNFALTLATKKQPFDSHDALEAELWPSNNFKNDVKNLCGLFISVYDGKLSFIHQTAREFLVHPTRHGEWQGRFNNMAKSHGRLSSICMQYLLLRGFSTDYIKTHKYRSFISPYPFLSYAAEFWPFHYRSQETAEAILSQNDALMLCCAPNVWAPIYLESWPDLTIASLLGLEQVVRELLLKKTNTATDLHQSLYFASESGYEAIVRILLDNGADVNAHGWGTALTAASGNGHKETVQILLDNGADVNIRGDIGSPLKRASERNHKEIVQMLLDSGADIDNGKDFPLCAASGMGHKEIVQILLCYGPDVNAYSRWGTPLKRASEHGHKEIVQMLLESGADIDNGKDFPLCEASEHGHKEIVQILLRYGPDVNAYSRWGTPLVSASRRGHKEIVQMLLDNGADINKGTPLRSASKSGHKEIVQMLLDCGVEVNVESSDGTALKAASENGHEDIVQILLKYGADVNIGSEAGTALQAASENGHKEIVQILLDKGAAVNASGFNGNTALIKASDRGYKEIVQILLDNGVDVSAQGDSGSTALWVASCSGHEEVVQILINNGADVNAQDEDGNTALWAAATGNHQEIVQMLLKHGADVNADLEIVGGSLLRISAALGQQEMVQILLDNCTGVNDQKILGSAIEAAAASGHEGIEQMLREKRAVCSVGM